MIIHAIPYNSPAESSGPHFAGETPALPGCTQLKTAIGVESESLVAIYAERSTDVMVGILGILKAGGAYVPLDPIHPIERILFMLEQCKAIGRGHPTVHPGLRRKVSLLFCSCHPRQLWGLLAK